MFSPSSWWGEQFYVEPADRDSVCILLGGDRPLGFTVTKLSNCETLNVAQAVTGN